MPKQSYSEMAPGGRLLNLMMAAECHGVRIQDLGFVVSRKFRRDPD
jgi:hypothetical protein